MAIPTWKMMPALICGNTVVIKPASDTPLTVVEPREGRRGRGLPAGRRQLRDGRRPRRGHAPRARTRTSALISFTGSTEVGRTDQPGLRHRLQARAAWRWAARTPSSSWTTRTSSWPSTASSGAPSAPPASAARPRAACLVQKGVYEKFIDMLAKRAKALKVGNGLDESVEMGPAVDEGQLKTDLELRGDRQEGGRDASSAAASASRAPSTRTASSSSPRSSPT